MNHPIQIRSLKTPSFDVARRIAGCGLIAMILSGCGRDEATVTVVPKESSAPPVSQLPPGHPETGATMPAGMDAAMGMANRPKLSYKAPEGWNEAPAGSMRVASFKIEKDGKQADFSVIPLAGAAGGEVANVNRWRGQVGLEPLDETDLKKTAESVQVAGNSAELYDIVGTNPGSGDPMRVLGVIQHRDGMAWFYKMSGDAALVASQKPVLVEFLKSVEYQAPPADPHAGMLPPSHPPMEGMGMGMGANTANAGPINREGQPKWTVPAGWQEVSGGQFLVAKFILREGDAEAAVNVSASAGDGGGFAANVNRWRRQIGLGETSEAEIKSQAKPIGNGTLVDISGIDPRNNQPTRVVGVMVPQGGQTFFYKLAGESKLVGANKEAFEKFVQSAKY